jgi:hypothetical protein
MKLASMLFGTAVVSCGGLSSRIRAAPSTSCADVIAQAPAIRADSRYEDQPSEDREAYDLRLAECDLSMGMPEPTLELARSWPDRMATRRGQTVARAEAAQGNCDAAREALESIAGEAHLSPTFFLDTTELWPCSAEDWFVSLAIRAWHRSASPSLDEFASKLVHHAKRNLVPVTLASAEPGRGSGDWAVWTGRIEDARLDRDGDQTLLKAEGVEVKDEITLHEKLVSMETYRAWLGSYESTPKYTTERTHREVFEPNGRSFVVRYPGAREGLVAMHTITAFGRYAGRGEDGLPIMNAVEVVDRER